jgi:hypothetical protein
MRNIRFPDKAADIRDDRITLINSFDDAILHVHDKKCAIRPVLKGAHGFPPSRHADLADIVS